jgi:hypothetical protein
MLAQGILCKHGIKCCYAYGETQLRDPDGGARENRKEQKRGACQQECLSSGDAQQMQ